MIDDIILDKLANVQSALGELSIKFNKMQSDFREFEKQKIDPNFEEIQNQIKELERFQEITHLESMTNRKPYRCPICDGFGSRMISNPEFTESVRKHYIENNKCHACEGKGIVWG